MHQPIALPTPTAFRSFIRLVAGALATALMAAGCAMVTPRDVAYVPPPIGSTWTVARTDSGSFGSATTQVTTTRAEQMWQGQRVISYEAPGFTQLLRADGKLVAFMNGDKPMVSFEPELAIAYPLEVGKAATTDHKVTLYPSMRVVPMQVKQKIEAYESVTVPAGTFKAFRIAWSEDNGNDNVYWVSPDLGIVVKSILTRTSKSAAGPGQRVNELVAHSVK
jgi:hypothetical protein